MKRYIGSRALKWCDNQWTEPDLLNTPIGLLDKHYRRVFIKVLLDSGAIEIYDPKALLGELSYNETTFTLLRRLNDGEIYPTVDRIPDTRTDPAMYSNAYQAGYQLSVVDTDIPNPHGCSRRHRDALLSSPLVGVYASQAVESCLFTVNGILFRSEWLSGDTDDAVLLPKAGLTLGSGQHAHVGMVSFYKLGGLTLSDLELTRTDAPQELSDVMFLKIPYDPDRSVLLSWAGHLVIPKADVFWRVDDSTMALRLIGVPHIEQLMGMFSAINTDHLGLVTPSPKKQCLRDFYFSNPVLKTLLRSVNSFLITVNTPLLAVKTRPIRSHRYPGLLILGRKPELPLVSSPGRLCEYWRQPVDGYWHLNAKDTHYRDYALDGAALEANTVAKDRLKAGLVHHRAKLGFMEFLGYS